MGRVFVIHSEEGGTALPIILPACAPFGFAKHFPQSRLSSELRQR
jgi:hypothetical protein